MISYPFETVHCYLDKHVVVYTAEWQRSTKTGTGIRAIDVPVHPVISVVLDLTIESREDVARHINAYGLLSCHGDFDNWSRMLHASRLWEIKLVRGLHHKLPLLYIYQYMHTDQRNGNAWMRITILD
jgi:hypothetical protein